MGLLGSKMVTSQRTVKYLGVTFGRSAATKLYDRIGKLRRVMPNINGSYTIMLYAVPIRSDITETKKNSMLLEKAQETSLIGVIPAYRTMSTTKHLQAQKLARLYLTRSSRKKEKRCQTVERCQNVWQWNMTKGQWILISCVRKWLTCTHW